MKGQAVASLVLITLIVVCLYDIVFRRNWRRHTVYKAARRRSEQSGKPLVVIGANDLGGISGSIAGAMSLYGCGDMCVDLQGCPSCPNGVQADIKTVLPRMETNSAVVFVSVVLEYIDDLPSVMDELLRVSGGDLFVVYIDNMLDVVWPSQGDYTDLKTKKTLKRRWKVSIRNNTMSYHRIVQ